MTPDTEPSTRDAAHLIRRVVSSGAHLSYEQLESLVDGRAEPALQERIEAHASWCARCAAELQDLAAHAPTLRKRLQPAENPRAGWLTWLKSGPRLLPQIALASVVAAVALTVVFQDPRSGSDDHASRAQPGAVDNAVLTRLSEVSPEAAEAHRRGDEAALARLLKDAADRGNVTAALALGTLYAQGLGVAVDIAAAERYWKQAALAGSAEAQRNLDQLRSPQQIKR
ncbi:MAG: tetratricopeptide repeat protein [Rhizobacter sp.]